MDWRAVEQAFDPLPIFHEWLLEAEKSEPNDPNAAALATATGDGAPSVRMVLVKKVDERGFCFYTNADSRKGCELKENPRAALCFHWKSLRRQVRVEGPVVELPAEDADRYFQSRSRMSQVGAAVSQQSRPLKSRQRLEELVERFDAEHPGGISRPEYWHGYAVVPERIELWMDGDYRLHNRFLFVRKGDEWTRTRLFP
ncbi:pyridoxamine 5'-phosphate oxidase [Edaphobacter sp. 12200R-103]|jgi:pyridoxamine 5'-phosphate oxidase|uniref:pyridoxamine 5'-phosphate oxidase n=1 Tax=Edaphobacter sp. 12200R-103 TaxID=2703788 RepID=UPI00138B6E43|nr:pyridoxamine 5'-phosphate oxidase [Edaphobacter sp. 12200R-103]QHS51703.1 pyridoxamine 5'-phosphate oxidase [Edaphobacter sp. 12200R-103]